MMSVFLTHAYIFYLGHFMPYAVYSQNQSEIFNEVCTMLVSYFLMWLATFPDYDVGEVDQVEMIGWFYIGTASFNIIVNLLRLAWAGIRNLP